MPTKKQLPQMDQVLYYDSATILQREPCTLREKKLGLSVSIHADYRTYCQLAWLNVTLKMYMLVYMYKIHVILSFRPGAR